MEEKIKENEENKTSKLYQTENYRNDQVEFKMRVKRHRETSIRMPRTPYAGALCSRMNEKRLLEAANYNNTSQLIDLLKSGVSPNCSDHLKRSPLHIAVSRGFQDIVYQLLIHGADPNIIDTIGNTPLHLAACTANIGIVTSLINHGANLLQRDGHGLNPLQIAAGKLRLCDKLSKNIKGQPDELNLYRKTIVNICDTILNELRKQAEDPDIQSPSCSSSPTTFPISSTNEICEQFSEQLDKLKNKNVDLDSVTDQIQGLNLKNEIDTDVKALLSTLEKLSV